MFKFIIFEHMEIRKDGLLWDLCLMAGDEYVGELHKRITDELGEDEDVKSFILRLLRTAFACGYYDGCSVSMKMRDFL